MTGRKRLHHPLSRCHTKALSWYRINLASQLTHRRQAQQRKQHAAVANVDLGRLDQALAHVGQVRLQAQHHQGGDQGIEIASGGGVRGASL